MILTVTINPLVERRFQFRSVQYGTSNRNSTENLAAGGKGINISRELNLLGLDNTALTFAGGYSGKILRNLLNKENIKASCISTADETRNSSVIIDQENNIVTAYFGNNSRITESEASEFLIKLEKMISNCEMVVFSGSSPSRTTDQIFPEGIKIANRQDKISLLDTYGDHLDACIKASPTIIHNNFDEISSNYNITSESEVFSLLDEFYSHNIKQVYITNGSSQICASNFDFHYKIKPPSVDQKDATGSGDAFTSGIVWGWHNNLTFEETVIIASCLGAANASSYEVCKVALSEAEKYKNAVEIIPVGKKMKIIDVTPEQ
jgi:tagatose 6-phosphate kinase